VGQTTATTTTTTMTTTTTFVDGRYVQMNERMGGYAVNNDVTTLRRCGNDDDN